METEVSKVCLALHFMLYPSHSSRHFRCHHYLHEIIIFNMYFLFIFSIFYSFIQALKAHLHILYLRPWNSNCGSKHFIKRCYRYWNWKRLFKLLVQVPFFFWRSWNLFHDLISCYSTWKFVHNFPELRRSFKCPTFINS